LAAQGGWEGRNVVFSVIRVPADSSREGWLLRADATQDGPDSYREGEQAGFQQIKFFVLLRGGGACTKELNDE
jgi:hypothetical protein